MFFTNKLYDKRDTRRGFNERLIGDVSAFGDRGSPMEPRFRFDAEFRRHAGISVTALNRITPGIANKFRAIPLFAVWSGNETEFQATLR